MGNIALKDYVQTEFEDLRRDLNEGSIPKVAADYQECLNQMQNLPLHIAVTGQAGAGKSSFVNAFRGVSDDDEEAAKVAVGEGTNMPMAYPHPSFPNIKIWDLPGIGTCGFKAAEYLKKVQFERYDVFIVVTADRFTENDALLAKEIQRMRKKFYYVRTKVDVSIDGERRRRNFNLEETLGTMRKYCEGSWRRVGELPARVFLISKWQVHMYDFPLLQERMAAELPDHKKHILTLAVQIFSEENLMMKKAEMKSYIKKVAWVSCACGALPVPGSSIACDVAILLDALKCFRKVFGLDERSLHFLALQTGKGFTELRSAIQESPLADTISIDFVTSLLLRSAVYVSVAGVELLLYSIPLLGSLFGGASSFATTYYFLNDYLEKAVEDARRVHKMFLK
ncbi:interferon-inducible GTPase 5-like [Candoia aspera]|uniref:interferon-inducible GTPase 5-like n=1 Tax=Candoia aspera TaxID=51853 RepID=UPI002FD80990